jgi:tetratricopeptide (TPR) repeat protein
MNRLYNQKSWSKFWMLFILLHFGLFAQQTQVELQTPESYFQGLELYKAKQYLSAQVALKNSLQGKLSEEQKAEANYVIAIAAIRLGQANGEALLVQFVEEFPMSPKRNTAFLEVGDYYFEQNNFVKSYEWYQKVQEGSLSQASAEKYYFQRGYAAFANNKKKEAISSLKKVENSKEFGSQAKYYIGYIEYESDNFKAANDYFGKIEDNPVYKEKMSYYQADMNFKLGNFQKAIDLGLAAMAKSDANEKSELNKIIGESYFNLKQYDKAIPYLKEYKGKKGKWTNTDFYLLGYAYYQQKDYPNAISQFNKIIDGKDFVAQNAYYHLGESYLLNNQKSQALNAFKNASEMSFDAKIQEDAFYNYAKLSYDIGNPYQSVPDVLQAFVKKYPNTAYKAEMEQLLISSYITSKNYKDALALLEKTKTSDNRPIYQKVTFYRGLEFYIDGNYKDALQMFSKSLAEPRDPKFVARAMFWKGEVEYHLDQFKDALLSFQQFKNHNSAPQTPEFKNLDYHLAYAHFKLKEYEASIPFFQKSISVNSSDKVKLNDSYLRLADAYFVTAKYWPAMENYNKAIELGGSEADYAAYQKALSYGFVDRTPKKIEDLQAFLKKYPKSPFRDDAIFELGNTYTNQNQTELALKMYDQLHQEFPKGTFTSKAILRQGLIYYNSNRPNPAIEKFKRVAKEFPNTPEALEAVATAREIYVDLGKVEEYADWVKTLDYIEVTNMDLDNTTYESAEKQYLQNNTKNAISGFQQYLAKFPNGIHATKANFYLAQLYFADGLENNALPHYLKVVEKSKNEYTEASLARISEIYLKNKDFAKAESILKRLEVEADFPQNVLYAQSNLMKSYYELENYSQVVNYAEKVLGNAKVDERIKNDAQIMIARAYIKTNNEAKAKEAYAKLLPTAKGELAAEAWYYDAYFKNKEGKWEASNTTIQKITKDFAGYKYWGAKSLVVMGKNFYGLKDSFQATYILEAVIKNFAEYNDVVQEATTELNKIKTEEAKRNASVGN